MANVLDKAAVKALRELVRQEAKPSGPLPPAPSRAVPAQTGVARPAGLRQDDGGGGGGIASPLSEVPGSRVYYAPQNVTTTDGAIIFRIEALKEIQFEDANGETVAVQFQSS